jgi:hypothetical protein
VLGLVALGESSVEAGGLELWCPAKGISMRVCVSAGEGRCWKASCGEVCLRRRCCEKVESQYICYLICVILPVSIPSARHSSEAARLRRPIGTRCIELGRLAQRVQNGFRGHLDVAPSHFAFPAASPISTAQIFP